MIESVNPYSLSGISTNKAIAGHFTVSLITIAATTALSYQFFLEREDPEGIPNAPLLGVAAVTVISFAVKSMLWTENKRRGKRCVVAKAFPIAVLAGCMLAFAIYGNRSSPLVNACQEYYRISDEYSKVQNSSGCERLQYCGNVSSWIDSCHEFEEKAENSCLELMRQNSTFEQCFVQDGAEIWHPEDWSRYPYGPIGGSPFHCTTQISVSFPDWNNSGYIHKDGYPLWYNCSNFQSFGPPDWTGKIIPVATGELLRNHLSGWCTRDVKVYDSNVKCKTKEQLDHIWPNGTLVLSDDFFVKLSAIKAAIPEWNAEVHKHDNCTVQNPYLPDLLHARENLNRLAVARFSHWDAFSSSCETGDFVGASPWVVTMSGAMEIMQLLLTCA